MEFSPTNKNTRMNTSVHGVGVIRSIISAFTVVTDDNGAPRRNDTYLNRYIVITESCIKVTVVGISI
jgi:hypothetical protein